MERREREVSLRDYLEIIIKRKGIIILSVVVVTISSILLVPAKPAVYKATAFIIVEGSPYNIDLIASIKRFIKTHALAEEVTRYMEFDRAKTLKAGGELAEGVLSEITPTSLLNSLLVEQQEEGSDILAISVLTDEPKKAMDMANVTARVVVEQSIKGVAGGAKSSIKYIERQMDILRQDVEATKQLIAGYGPATQESAAMLPAEAKDFEKLQQDYINAKLNRQMTEAKLKVLEERIASLKGNEDILSVMPQSREVLQLKDKYAQLEQRLSGLLMQFTEEHPKVIETRGEMEQVEMDIEKEAVEPLDDLRLQIAEYKNTEDTAKKVLEMRFPVVSSEAKEGQAQDSRLRQLNIELSIDEKTYNRLSEEKEKLRMDSVLNATKVRILKLAAEPQKPEKPQGVPAIIIALSLGMVLGLTAAFLQENVDTSLKTLEDVEYYLNKPIVGVIPMIRTDAKRRAYHHHRGH